MLGTRRGRGWTGKDVAEPTGIYIQTYGDTEVGRTWPVPATRYWIAEALEVDLRMVPRENAPAPKTFPAKVAVSRPPPTPVTSRSR